MEPTVTTAKAAEIVDIGYEGLRSYLKRGLLGRSGILLPLVASDAPAPDLSNARAKWKRFGYTDLCLIRLAKQLIDLGLSFDQANGIASNEDVRRIFNARRSEGNSVLLAWPPYFDFIVFRQEDLRYLPDRLTEAGDSAVLVQVGRTRQQVRAAFDQALVEQEGSRRLSQLKPHA